MSKNKTKRPDLKVVRPKDFTFIDLLIEGVQKHYEKERKRIAKNHFENVTELKEACDELNNC